MIRNIISTLVFCALLSINAWASETPRKSTSSAPAEMLNINSATVKQLAQLKGVGKSKAQAIVTYRINNGEFSSIDELAKVKGIGKKIVTANRSRLTIDTQ